jgi:hypothetical protein
MVEAGFWSASGLGNLSTRLDIDNKTTVNDWTAGL